jgi:hypothetical protein
MYYLANNRQLAISILVFVILAKVLLKMYIFGVHNSASF